jgi:hypothetical protein
MIKFIKTFCLSLAIAASLPSLAIAEPHIAPFTPSVRQIIVKQAVFYATPIQPLLQVALCESTMRVDAFNPRDVDGLPAYGLFQFKMATFLRYAKLAGIEKPDIWNAEQQAKTAAYMFSTGQKKQWGCK